MHVHTLACAHTQTHTHNYGPMDTVENLIEYVTIFHLSAIDLINYYWEDRFTKVCNKNRKFSETSG